MKIKDYKIITMHPMQASIILQGWQKINKLFGQETAAPYRRTYNPLIIRPKSYSSAKNLRTIGHP